MLKLASNTLVSTDWLAQRLHDDSIIIADCRFSLTDPNAGRRAYETAHIPGAQYMHLDLHLSGAKTGTNGRHPLPDAGALQSTLRQFGVTSDTTLIAYDDANSMFAARLWWMMRWAGLSNCVVLDGGWKKWIAEARPVTTEVRSRQASDIELRMDEKHRVRVDEVEKRLDQPDRMQIVDARAPDRFRGENETLDPVGGHIPGALNRFFQANLDDNGCFKSADELRQEFASLLGTRSANAVVHQCGSGVTACHNLLAMEIAGLSGSRLYAGSWSEWCAAPQRPVERS